MGRLIRNTIELLNEIVLAAFDFIRYVISEIKDTNTPPPQDDTETK